MNGDRIIDEEDYKMANGGQPMASNPKYTTDYTIRYGDRIAQLVITPVVQPKITIIDDLTSTDSGTNGFDSTGKN